MKVCGMSQNEHLLNTGTRRKLETHKSTTYLRDV